MAGVATITVRTSLTPFTKSTTVSGDAAACVVSSHPPATALAIFAIDEPNRRPRPTGISQMGATDRCNGRSSPPSLCST